MELPQQQQQMGIVSKIWHRPVKPLARRLDLHQQCPLVYDLHSLSYENYIANCCPIKKIDWRKEDTALLHRYRRAYALSCPSAFENPMANCILQSGIGPQSPTMARAKNKRRIRREELAMIVRRNFKEAPVVENECVVTLLYKVQMKGMTL